MPLWSRPPRSPALRGVVSLLWYCEIGPPYPPETLLPTGRAEVVLGLSPEEPGALLLGPAGRPRTIRAAMQRRAAGVAFAPGGLAPLLGDRVDAVADLEVDLVDAWGRGSVALQDELAGTRDPGSLLDRLERHLGRRLREQARPSHGTPDDVVARVEPLLRGGASVADVVAVAGLDRRVLAARFREAVGFGLKHYGRVSRFERALRSLRHTDAEPLAVLAVTHGYADQAHMTREFRELAGLTPGALHRRASDSPTHVLGDGRRDDGTDPHDRPQDDEIVKTPGRVAAIVGV